MNALLILAPPFVAGAILLWVARFVTRNHKPGDFLGLAYLCAVPYAFTTVPLGLIHLVWAGPILGSWWVGSVPELLSTLAVIWFTLVAFLLEAFSFVCGFILAGVVDFQKEKLLKTIKKRDKKKRPRLR
ncbi:MAG: hypothetical protein UY78_C0043G0005 [Parcubacteria group bacterium GW2011_GWA1_53_13]|nr:MAG: hypothetical protein UY78_C0043G0005 [Parcubacteria group bacterium GW2011_GWA1_53_13]